MIETRTFTIGDGGILVLYTDGLVENRGQDIDDGLARLRGVFGPEALLARSRTSPSRPSTAPTPTTTATTSPS